MSDERYQVARLDEIERLEKWTPIRSHFGIEAFGVNSWTSSATGGELINEHDEVSSGHEELYLVLDGRATFTVDGNEVDAPAGTIVFVDEPATKRKAVAAEPETTVLSIGAKPGEAFKPLGWEWSAKAFPFFRSGEPERAYEILVAANEAHPDAAGVLYNLACAEALLGKQDEALAHLRRAVELFDGFAEIARDDPDFDSIRSHPGFVAA
jgi:tetratricopeptide (TPR) repeat protein